MPSCPFCGYTTNKGGITCPICSSKLPEDDEAGGGSSPAANKPVAPGRVAGGGDRFCPACGKTYTSDYADTFCLCGVELSSGQDVPNKTSPVAQAPAPAAAAVVVPPPGTRCLVLYGPGKRPLHYFPLTKDVTLIGRQDAVAGCFPDVDLGAYFDDATARKVSRRHALILHSRSHDSYLLRPLAGNTGTQLEADMVLPMQDYPLEPGRRLILGGAVRLKFDVT